jgi:hypothetical protein
MPEGFEMFCSFCDKEGHPEYTIYRPNSRIAICATCLDQLARQLARHRAKKYLQAEVLAQREKERAELERHYATHRVLYGDKPPPSYGRLSEQQMVLVRQAMLRLQIHDRSKFLTMMHEEVREHYGNAPQNVVSDDFVRTTIELLIPTFGP